MLAAPTTTAAASTEASNSLDADVAARLLDDARLQTLEHLLDLGQIVSQDEIGRLEGRTSFVAQRIGVLSVVMAIWSPSTVKDTQPAVSVRTTASTAPSSSETVSGYGCPKGLPSAHRDHCRPRAQIPQQADRHGSPAAVVRHHQHFRLGRGRSVQGPRPRHRRTGGYPTRPTAHHCHQGGFVELVPGRGGAPSRRPGLRPLGQAERPSRREEPHDHPVDGDAVSRGCQRIPTAPPASRCRSSRYSRASSLSLLALGAAPVCAVGAAATICT